MQKNLVAFLCDRPLLTPRDQRRHLSCVVASAEGKAITPELWASRASEPKVRPHLWKHLSSNPCRWVLVPLRMDVLTEGRDWKRGLLLMAIPRIHSIFISGLDFILLECKCQDQSCVMSLQEVQMVPLL